jgi:hypothetical protein
VLARCARNNYVVCALGTQHILTTKGSCVYIMSNMLAQACTALPDVKYNANKLLAFLSEQWCAVLDVPAAIMCALGKVLPPPLHHMCTS